MIYFKMCSSGYFHMAPVPLAAGGLSSVAHLEPFQSLLRTGTYFDPVLIFLHHTRMVSVCV